ncbi:MAG: sulfotransferase, partial [Flavobacteriales bacterium]|nr:sulfotransferase [Flavobacteriales bacterium]
MQISFKGNKVNLPDFMIVGAAKSGTTTLYRILAEHPQIYFPPSEKEPFYFCFGGKEPRELNEITRNRAVWKTEDYFNLYSGVDNDMVSGDASTSYLYKHETSISHMSLIYGKRLEELKIIILLRNPVDRAYSHYTFLVRNGFEELSFEDALMPRMIESRRRARWGFDYLNYGAYADQVAHYMSRFPHCKVYLTEDLKDKQSLINDITEFLSVDRLEIRDEVTANPSGIPKSRFLVD